MYPMSKIFLHESNTVSMSHSLSRHLVQHNTILYTLDTRDEMFIHAAILPYIVIISALGSYLKIKQETNFRVLRFNMINT